MTDLADPTDLGLALIQAATEVFAERGYDGAGVAEIARRAGVTTGAIYSRYSGKAELLAAAIASCTSDELDELFAQHAFEGRATDILATVGSHLVTRPANPGQALLLEAFVAARRDPEVATALRQHLDRRTARMGRLIDESKADGLIDATLDTQALVHFAHAVGLGFLLFEAVGVDQPAPGDWQAVIERLVGSIMAPGAESPTSSPTAPSGAAPAVTHPRTPVPDAPASIDLTTP